MATRGKRPTPTALLELRGTRNATRHKARDDEPKPEGDLHAAPDWLTPSQKQGWAYAIRHAPAGLLKHIDRTVLVVWVVAEDQHRRAAIVQAEIDARNPNLPMVVPRSRGKLGTELVESPYLRIMARQAEAMLRCASELGFSPAARPRLAARNEGGAKNGDGPADPWARLKLLQGGKA